MRKAKVLAMAVAVALMAGPALAWVGYDDATHTVYNDGWQHGDNGGTGFGAWHIRNWGGMGGTFVGSSTGNAGGSGGIDIGGRSWGMWAGGTASGVSAGRTFTGGAFVPGYTFRVNFDNGWLDSGSVGWLLETDDGGHGDGAVTLFGWQFFAGATHYQYLSGGTAVNSGIQFTGHGLDFEFYLASSTAWNLKVWVRDATGGYASSSTFSGTLNANTAIGQFRAYNSQAGAGSNYDLFINRMEVIPEPGTLALMGLAITGLLVYRRRR